MDLFGKEILRLDGVWERAVWRLDGGEAIMGSCVVCYSSRLIRIRSRYSALMRNVSLAIF